MSDFGGGFDWNGNGSRDTFDDYMDYKLSGSDKSGGGSGGSGGPGGGDGCLTTIGAIAIMLVGLYLFGSCCL